MAEAGILTKAWRGVEGLGQKQYSFGRVWRGAAEVAAMGLSRRGYGNAGNACRGWAAGWEWLGKQSGPQTS